MSVRLPSAADYASAILKEQQWLPKLSQHLPQPIPKPLGLGKPCAEFPHHWSIYSWLPGDFATPENVTDHSAFARDIGNFLKALQQIPSAQGPTPDSKQSIRGGPVAVLDAGVQRAINHLGTQIDTRAATHIWHSALAETFSGPPVWIHGDVAAGNLLVTEGKLGAVIDFGEVSTGDPACDLAIAWTFLDRPSRQVFRDTLSVDDGCWNRGRGWALWKALIIEAQLITSNAIETAAAPRVLKELFEDYRRNR